MAGGGDREWYPPAAREVDGTRREPCDQHEDRQQHREAQRRLWVDRPCVDDDVAQQRPCEHVAEATADEQRERRCEYGGGSRGLAGPDERRSQHRQQPALQPLGTGGTDDCGHGDDEGDDTSRRLRRDGCGRIGDRQQDREARHRTRQQAHLRSEHRAESDVVRRCGVARRVQRSRWPQHQHEHTDRLACHFRGPRPHDECASSGPRQAWPFLLNDLQRH